MKSRPTARVAGARQNRIHAFEIVLKELTFRELLHLSAVLKRDGGRASRNRMVLVRKELDGRPFVPLQPELVAL